MSDFPLMIVSHLLESTTTTQITMMSLIPIFQEVVELFENGLYHINKNS